MSLTVEQLQELKNTLMEAKGAFKSLEETCDLFNELEFVKKQLQHYEEGVSKLVAAAQDIADAMDGADPEKMDPKLLFNLRVGLERFLTTKHYALR